MCFIEAGMAGLQMVGGIVQTIGSNAAGKAAEAEVKQNAAMRGQLASDAINRGGIDAANKRKEYMQLLGTQRAAMAANGVTLDSGTPLDVQLDTATVGEYDAQTVMNNAMREAWGHRVEQTNLLNQRKAMGFQRRLNNFTTLLTAGAQAGGTAMSGYQSYKARGRTFI